MLLCWYLTPWTAEVFDILHILCGQFTSVNTNNLLICLNWFFTFLGIFTFNKSFFSKSVHLLNQIVTFNQSIRIIRHLGCHQTNETSINKMNLAEVEYEWYLDVFTHSLMQLTGTWSALTCSYKYIMFWYFKPWS